MTMPAEPNEIPPLPPGPDNPPGPLEAPSPIEEPPPDYPPDEAPMPNPDENENPARRLSGDEKQVGVGQTETVVVQREASSSTSSRIHQPASDAQEQAHLLKSTAS